MLFPKPSCILYIVDVLHNLLLQYHCVTEEQDWSLNIVDQAYRLIMGRPIFVMSSLLAILLGLLKLSNATPSLFWGRTSRENGILRADGSDSLIDDVFRQAAVAGNENVIDNNEAETATVTEEDEEELAKEEEEADDMTEEEKEKIREQRRKDARRKKRVKDRHDGQNAMDALNKYRKKKKLKKVILDTRLSNFAVRHSTRMKKNSDLKHSVSSIV